MEVQKAYALPADARHLNTKPGRAGFDADGSLCWTLSKSKLLIWSAEMEHPTVMTAGLPYFVSHALVSALAVKVSRSLQYPVSSALAIAALLLCRSLQAQRVSSALQKATC